MKKRRIEKILIAFLVAFGLIFNFSSDKANVIGNTNSVIDFLEDETIGGKH